MKTKGATSYQNVKLKDLLTHFNEEQAIPVQRRWLEQFTRPVTKIEIKPLVVKEI